MSNLSDFQRRTLRGLLFNGLFVLLSILWFKFGPIRTTDSDWGWLLIVVPPFVLGTILYVMALKQLGLNKNGDAINAGITGDIPKRSRSAQDKIIACLVLLASIIGSVLVFLKINGTGSDIDLSYVVYAVVPAIGLANLILDMLDKNVLFD